jgi:hypothetical protein
MMALSMLLTFSIRNFDLLSIYVGEAIAGGVWDIDHGGARLDDGFDHFGQVDVVGAAGVFGVEFHVDPTNLRAYFTQAMLFPECRPGLELNLYLMW